MPKIGDKGPEFRLRSLDGGFVSLADLRRDGPVAIVFFKVSCPTCQFTLPFLQRLRDRNVVAISQDAAEATREFHEAFGITLPTLLDERREGYPASNAWGLTNVPTLFVVEQDGSISTVENGFSRSGLEALGAKLGRPVFRPGEQTPAFRPG